MAREQYQEIRFTDAVLDLIDTIDGIIDEYLTAGFKLTVRQLYYQLVARDIVPNTLQSYKRVANIVNDARVAGRLDWDAIEDRTREFIRQQRWDSPQELLHGTANAYHIDMWRRQRTRVFVVIEKEALVGVLEPTCRGFDVPILAARGYPSGTVLREFVQTDLLPMLEEGRQDAVILHLGDHDPSGIDMTRDLTERLRMFARDYEHQVQLRRIALNMEQIAEHRPPPNPAKTTDSRFREYMRRFGNDSWELDALPPQYLAELVEGEIRVHLDMDQWNLSVAHVKMVREKIHETAKNFFV